MLLLLVMRIWRNMTITLTLVTNQLRLNWDCKEVWITMFPYQPTNQQTMDQVPAKTSCISPNLTFFKFISKDIRDSMSYFCCSICYKLSLLLAGVKQLHYVQPHVFKFLARKVSQSFPVILGKQANFKRRNWVSLSWNSSFDSFSSII